MMETFKHFSKDCSTHLKEMARRAKRDAVAAKGTDDESFQLGSQMAYYAVISLLRQQAHDLQIPLSDLDLADIDPDEELL